MATTIFSRKKVKRRCDWESHIEVPLLRERRSEREMRTKKLIIVAMLVGTLGAITFAHTVTGDNSYPQARYDSLQIDSVKSTK